MLSALRRTLRTGWGVLRPNAKHCLLAE